MARLDETARSDAPVEAGPTAAATATPKAGPGTYLALHLLLAFFSFNGIFSKLAAQHPVFSLPFILYYGASIGVLGVYAIGWQQVIKRLPLTTAYANRAVTIVWGLVWGMLIFHEQLNPPKVIGALIVLVGVALFAWADSRPQTDEEVAR